MHTPGEGRKTTFPGTRAEPAGFAMRGRRETPAVTQASATSLQNQLCPQTKAPSVTSDTHTAITNGRT
uniref:Uncharacterized protein n=1 Tax=Anguilla anguilla TaxID=7936 RepID=A0A0E9RV90_ANGAN